MDIQVYSSLTALRQLLIGVLILGFSSSALADWKYESQHYQFENNMTAYNAYSHTDNYTVNISCISSPDMENRIFHIRFVSPRHSLGFNKPSGMMIKVDDNDVYELDIDKHETFTKSVMAIPDVEVYISLVKQFFNGKTAHFRVVESSKNSDVSINLQSFNDNMRLVLRNCKRNMTRHN